MKTGIYKITNTITNCSYIGSSVNIDRRFRQHRHSLKHNKHVNTYLQNSWNKYGENVFIFEIIEIVVDFNNLLKREQYHIDICNFKYNLNVVTPTRLGSKANAETKKRLSESHKGKISPKKGLKTGKPAWNSGKTDVYSKESLQKMSASKKGKRFSIKTEFKKGIISNKNRLRPILCIELNKEFDCIANAARFVGNVNRQSNILAVCNGKQKTAYSYTWRFI